MLQGTTGTAHTVATPKEERHYTSGAHSHTAVQQRLAWQGPEIIDSCRSAPDILYAGPPDLREGG